MFRANPSHHPHIQHKTQKTHVVRLIALFPCITPYSFGSTFSPPVETRVWSPEEAEEAFPHNHNPLVSQSANIPVSRKQRLSADTTGIPRPSPELTAAPRLHDVLDPLPLSTLESDRSIDEWFKSNFDTLFAIPPPVDVVEPDLSAQWDVELFSNYNIPPEEPQKRPFKSLNPREHFFFHTFLQLTLEIFISRSIDIAGYTRAS